MTVLVLGASGSRIGGRPRVRLNAEVPAAAARAAAALDISLVHGRRCASSSISVVDRHTPEILRV